MTTNRETYEEQGARAPSTPESPPASAPSDKGMCSEITAETDLNQFVHCNVRSKRIDVLTEVGRRVLEEFPNIAPERLGKVIIQKAMDLWEVRDRTAKDYLRRVMPRLEKMRSSSSSFRPMLNEQGEDYARIRNYVELLRQNPTHDRQEES
ncbi:MAG: hypothetical protein WCC94_07110 [Candidatus Bathyarchaeia archaeon]